MAIDPRQRYEDSEALLRVALGANQAGVWTAMPGIVQSYSAAQGTVKVQLAISGAIQKSDGTVEPANYPPLQDVPVVFPRGGNCTLTFPVAVGDECLVIFASRAIDWWWKLGGTNNPPAEARMHDLSDGFALLGPFSQPTLPANISTSTVQLRSNDGQSYVELNPSGHICNIVAPGGVNITGPLSVTGAVNVSGAVSLANSLTAAGSISSNVDVQAQAGSISLVNHVHGNVQSGGSTTGPAVG